ncbi:MAG: chromate transporter [Ruminococcaceae bacterium]|nr:chromate transporter [Oscillospiraceae bacterium]
MLKKLKVLFSVFWVFFRIGAFTFGGGYAMIPLISEETVNRRKWISESDILDIIAIAESTPGPVAINSATFVGYRVAGFWGSFFATLGVVSPSFIIILILSYVLNEFKSLKAVQYAFNGIRAGVLALIIKALIKMYKQCPKGVFYYVIMALSLVAVAFFKFPVIYCIIGFAALGLVYSLTLKGKVEK